MSDYTQRQLQDSLIAAGILVLREETAALRSLAEQMGVAGSRLDEIDAAITEARVAQTAVLSVHLPAYTAYRATWQTALREARQEGYDPHEGRPIAVHKSLHDLYTQEFGGWTNTIAAPKAHYQHLLSRVFRLCDEAGLSAVTGWLSEESSAFDMTEEHLLQLHGLQCNN